MTGLSNQKAITMFSNLHQNFNSVLFFYHGWSLPSFCRLLGSWARNPPAVRGRCCHSSWSPWGSQLLQWMAGCSATVEHVADKCWHTYEYIHTLLTCTVCTFTCVLTYLHVLTCAWILSCTWMYSLYIWLFVLVCVVYEYAYLMYSIL